MNCEINEMINKHFKFKTNFDDCVLEIRHRSEQLRDVQIKTENLTNKFKYNESNLLSDKNRTSEDNVNKIN